MLFAACLWVSGCIRGLAFIRLRVSLRGIGLIVVRLGLVLLTRCSSYQCETEGIVGAAWVSPTSKTGLKSLLFHLGRTCYFMILFVFLTLTVVLRLEP